jgi:hypothetical protein
LLSDVFFAFEDYERDKLMIQGQSGGAFHGSTHLSEFCPGRCLIAIGMQYELDIDEGQAQILLRISISASTGVLGDDLLFSPCLAK